MKKMVNEIQIWLRGIVEKHGYKGRITQTETIFCLTVFKIPHFYIVWKNLKDPLVGRPFVAGYDWILTPASIYIGMFFIKFYFKFEKILTVKL